MFAGAPIDRAPGRCADGLARNDRDTARWQRSPRRARHQELPLRKVFGHGGARIGAGRKPSRERAGVPHRRRERHLARHPLHVTLRAREGLPSFRSDGLLYEAMCRSLASSERDSLGSALCPPELGEARPRRRLRPALLSLLVRWLDSASSCNLRGTDRRAASHLARQIGLEASWPPSAR